MSSLRISLTSHDSGQLDTATRLIVNAVPGDEVADMDITVAARIGGFQRRVIWLSEPSEKIAGILAKVDVPNQVELLLRDYA